MNEDAQFQQAVEAALERSDAAQRAIIQRLDQQERVLLWLAKQPWEVDAATTWDQLIEKAHAEPAKAMKFRETTVT